MELHHYLQHFSSIFDNTQYEKSPRTKQPLRDSGFRQRRHSESHILRERRRLSLHRTMCIKSWRSRKSNRPFFTLPPRNPTRLNTPKFSATKFDVVPLKTNTNICRNTSITARRTHIAVSPLAGHYLKDPAYNSQDFRYHLSH